MKEFITGILEWQAKRLLRKHRPKIIAIAGSVGKTSTKLFTATVLSEAMRVHVQVGGYNTHLTVPMAILGLQVPTEVTSLRDWLRVLWAAEQRVRQAYTYDAVIIELGTDKPGDIKQFAKYLHPDIAVVTAVVPEHMSNFKSLDAVAQEELSVGDFSDFVFINRDDVDAAYVDFVKNTNLSTYGLSGVAEYHCLVENFEPGVGFSATFVSPEYGELAIALRLVGEHTVKPATVAAAIGVKLGLSAEQVVSGLAKIRPVAGRMQLLRGVKRSTIIDDSYNSSPASAVAALQTLYTIPGTQKIAILGSMNELGDYSQKAHEDVGASCDPTILDWIITIGDEAERYLAPAASNRGCRVRSFKSPYEAGAFAHQILEEGAAILVKGSQNGVFAEEAVKVLLHSTDEERFLVRQAPEWRAKKEALFDKFQRPGV